jgi:hypothetical protein
MKKNVEEGRLGDERYRLVAFAIFGLVLFPFEIGVINVNPEKNQGWIKLKKIN